MGERDLRDRFVKQFAGIERAEVVAPAVGDSWNQTVQLDDVEQEPAAIVPGRWIVAHLRQAVVLVYERGQIRGMGEGACKTKGAHVKITPMKSERDATTVQNADE